MVDIAGRVAFVTGGSRGLGAAIVQELLARGASKVYATGRAVWQSDDPRIVPVALEVTDAQAVASAAAEASDVSILVNNAGVAYGEDIISGDLDRLREELEIDYIAPIRVARAFVPVIEGAGGGAILNVHSVLSWIALSGSYSAAKAALWSATNSMRLELADRGISVVGLHVGYIDTDMTADVQAQKSAPADVARAAVNGLADGEYEVLADELSRTVRAGLSGGVAALYPQLAAQRAPQPAA